MMTPEQIRDLRDSLDENRAAFGKRFAVAARTVEQWEQRDPDGEPRRRPNLLALRLLQRLARRVA